MRSARCLGDLFRGRRVHQIARQVHGIADDLAAAQAFSSRESFFVAVVVAERPGSMFQRRAEPIRSFARRARACRRRHPRSRPRRTAADLRRGAEPRPRRRDACRRAAWQRQNPPNKPHPHQNAAANPDRPEGPRRLQSRKAVESRAVRPASPSGLCRRSSER